MTGRRGQSGSGGMRRRAGFGSPGCAAAEQSTAVPAGQVVPNPGSGVGSILAGDSQGVPVELLAAASAGDGSRDTAVTGLEAPGGWLCPIVPGAIPKPLRCCLIPGCWCPLFLCFLPQTGRCPPASAALPSPVLAEQHTQHEAASDNP